MAYFKLGNFLSIRTYHNDNNSERFSCTGLNQLKLMEYRWGVVFMVFYKYRYNTIVRIWFCQPQLMENCVAETSWFNVILQHSNAGEVHSFAKSIYHKNVFHWRVVTMHCSVGVSDSVPCKCFFSFLRCIVCMYIHVYLHSTACFRCPILEQPNHPSLPLWSSR